MDSSPLANPSLNAILRATSSIALAILSDGARYSLLEDPVTPLDQVEMLERAFQRNIKVRAISPRLFDVAHWLFACFARYSQWCRDRAEFCRIGKFYATESMLVWNTNTAQYDAALTPETGADTLGDFYQAIASGRASVPIKGEHSLF